MENNFLKTNTNNYVRWLRKTRETHGFKPLGSKYWRDIKWRNILKNTHYEVKSAIRGRE